MIKIVLVFIAAALAWAAYQVNEDTKAAANAPLKPDMSASANAAAKQRWAEQDRLEQTRNIKISKWSWKKGGFDNVMIGTFTLENTNTFGVKDILIACEHTAPSGTVLGRTSGTVFQALKAKGVLTVKDFNMGLLHSQASQSSCAVKGFV